MPRGPLRAAARLMITACLLAGCRRSTEPPPTGTSSVLPDAVAMENNQAVVIAKNGKVELLRGASGSWSEAKVGDRLSVRDALRTAVGEADLAVDGVKVRLHE